MSHLLPSYLEYGRFELNYSGQTLGKYRDSLRTFIREIGDKDVGNICAVDFLRLKKKMMRRGLSASRIAGIIYGLRSFLGYCRDFLKIPVANADEIKPPKRIRRQVIYLTLEEVKRFIATIDLAIWSEFRFRVLVEVLLGTGMRISEALSLNRKDIDWERREAKIVGKGNKQRRVFFTDRSLYWIQRFLKIRRDNHEAIFITRYPHHRLKREDVWRFFDRHRRMARIEKKLTPHILRHTVATNLMFNGCPLAHIKEILGHARIDTTFRFYLGTDQEKAKEAHQHYLNLLN
jgi:integrase/recombinase XerD